MAQHISVLILRKNDPPPLSTIKPQGDLNITHVTILEGGMESGATSIMFVIQKPTGEYYTAQMSAGMYQTISSAIEGAEKRFKGQ